MTLPRVTWILNGAVVEMAPGWLANCTLGGFDRMTGELTLREYREANSPTQGAIVKGYQQSGDVVFEGRLAAPPQVADDDGRVAIAASGYRVEAEKYAARLLVSSRDMSQWTTVDADPMTGGDALSKIEAIAGNGKLKWHISAGDAIGVGATKRNGFVFWAEGCLLGAISFVMNYDTTDNKMSIQVDEDIATNLAGSTTVQTSATTAGNQGATKNPALAGTKDAVLLYLWMNDAGAYTPANGETFTVDNVRVNGTLTSAATYNAYQIVSFMATTLGWDVSGITTSTFNALPFDWDGGDWMEGMLYLAELEDKQVRVLDDRGAGPYVEYGAWGANTWTGLSTDGIRFDLTPNELFNRVLVWFETATGVRRNVTVSVSPDPLVASGIVNIYEYELQDRQADNTVASATATAIAARLATQRYSGTIDVTNAYDPQGRNNPYGIRAGDTFTIVDWDVAQSMTLRVAEAEYSATGVRLGIEQPLSLARLLQPKDQTVQRRKRRRR